MMFEFDWDGIPYDCEWFDDTDFESLDKVTQAYGVVFDDDGKICVVNVRHNENGWCLPGGGPEDCDENFEATLIREIDEEADLDIKEIKRIGYVRAGPRGKPEEASCFIRYIAKVDKIKEQSEDPAHGKIPLRKFVSQEEFVDVLNWGDAGHIHLKKALEALNETL